MRQPEAVATFPNGLWAYPRGVMRWALKAPILLHRLGLGWLMPPTLVLLTTTGRRSGLPRTTALEARRHGSKLYVISAWGTRAEWYRNLLADPVVRVQQGGRSYVARAVPIQDRDELWRALRLFRKNNPLVDPILAGTAGIPAAIMPDDPALAGERLAGVRLQEVEGPGPAGVRPDLAWVWGALAMGGLVVAALALRRCREPGQGGR